jgi:hypothetical protein
MAFIIPMIGAALGLGAVGTAALQIGAAVGLGFLAKSLAPKAKRSKSAAQGGGGQNLSLRIETDAPRQVILGRQATAGTLVYWQCTGDNNETLHMVVALADHECHQLVQVWVDGKLYSWNSETGIVSAHANKLKIRFYSGTSTQTVDTIVRNASGGRWTNNERGIGVCYAVIEVTEDERVFKGGIPQIVFVIEGAKLYDPREDDTAGGDGDQRWNDPSTWVYSNNSAVALYNVLRGIHQNGVFLMGLQAPADTIRMADFEAAANACDESVSLEAGGSEARYRCGVVIDVGPGLNPERDAIEALIEGMAGDVICAGGIYRIMAGVSQSSVATLTDADFIVTEPLIAEPRRARTELTNAISGSFSDPARSYNIVPLPTRRSSDDEDDDGGFQWTRALDLSGVTSRTQAQRVMEYRRKEARRQLRARGTLKARWFGIEPGDWVTINSTRRGWSGRTFRVGGTAGENDLTSGREFIEVDTEVDDWIASDEIADNEVADLPGGGPTLTAVTGWDVTPVVVEGFNGQQRPGLRATWTPITDSTVTSLNIEYRKVGDTVAMEVVVIDPSTGQRTWTEGIQGELVYEARAIPVTVPLRGVDWTLWDNTGDEVAQQIVGVAQLANGVPPDTITPEMLDAQSRFLLGLITATDEVLGSVSQQVTQAVAELSLLGQATIQSLAMGGDNRARITVERTERATQDQALAQQITTAIAQLNGVAAAVQQEITARVTGQDALAQLISTVSTQVDDQTFTVQVIQQSIDGIAGKAGLSLGANNEIIGYALLDGTVEGSTFTVAANAFQVALFEAVGGSPVPVFGISMVNGVPRLALRADMIADGSIAARHITSVSIEALTAAFGSGTFAGIVQSAATANGSLRLNFANPEIRLTTA